MGTTQTQEALNWWESLGDNFLERILLKGELCTKYYTWMRRPSSLKNEEILTIYLSENLVDQNIILIFTETKNKHNGKDIKNHERTIIKL